MTVCRRTSWTAADLMAATFPEPRWAVPGVVPEGLTLLAGPPKLGKSWLMLNAAIAVAAGGHAFGRVPVPGGTSLYLALEDPARRMQGRLAVTLEGSPPPENLHIETVWPLLHDGGADLLDQWLTEHPGCRLVVVDVFAKVRGTASDKEDRYTADYRAISRLKDVADAHEVAVVAVHHTRKQQSDDFLELVSGTNGLAGAADTVLVLSRSRGTADAKLHITGRDVEERNLALSLDQGRWTLLDGSAEDHERGETRRRVLDLLTEQGPMTPKQVADVLDIGHELAKKTCRRMVDDRELTSAKGVYTPVPAVPVPELFTTDEGDGDAGDTHLPPEFEDTYADYLEQEVPA